MLNCLILLEVRKTNYVLEGPTFMGGAELTMVMGLKIETKGICFEIKRGLYLYCNLL